jgi:probable F420-dependent oxidoreductase
MKLGVVFPQTEIGIDPERIRSYAVGVEEAGFDHLVAYDHVLGHRPPDLAAWSNLGPYTDMHAFHEVFVLFSHLAAITSRIEYATEVLVLPQRQTVLVAKQAAELDLLSGGRLRLGIGVGWNPEEFRALDMNFHDRGKRSVEQIEVLRRLWSGEITTMNGSFHTINAGALNPRPAHKIPIWLGGHAAVTLKRAAAIADGFMLEDSLDEAPAVIATIQSQLVENGRDPLEFGLAARIQLREDDVGVAVQKAQAWERLGATHLSVNTMGEGMTDPDRHLIASKAFIEAWNRSLKVERRS